MRIETLTDVFKLIEKVKGEDEIEGIVARYAEQLTSEEGSQKLVDRLELRREELRQWQAVVELIKHLRMRQAASVRHELETATSKVITAEGAPALAEVAKEHPVVFTGSFIHTLIELQRDAVKRQDVYTARLIASRLNHLQLLQLASLQGLEVTDRNLRDVVYLVLESSNFSDLLENIRNNPVVFSEAFDHIMTDIGKEAVAQGDKSIPKVTKLRIAVLKGLRKVLETVVTKRPAVGGPSDAVEELNGIVDAEQFLDVIARYPFVLGEDFGVIIAREMANAKIEGEAAVLDGLTRRMGHLKTIGEIISRLSSQAETAG